MAPPHSIQTRTYNTRFKPEEWEAHRSRICELYLTPTNTLEIVARIMKDEGFNATVKQHKDRLRIWGIKKYQSTKRRGRQTGEQKNTPIPAVPEPPTSLLGQREIDTNEAEEIYSDTSTPNQVHCPKPKALANPVLSPSPGFVPPKQKDPNNFSRMEIDDDDWVGRLSFFCWCGTNGDGGFPGWSDAFLNTYPLFDLLFSSPEFRSHSTSTTIMSSKPWLDLIMPLSFYKQSLVLDCMDGDYSLGGFELC